MLRFFFQRKVEVSRKIEYFCLTSIEIIRLIFSLMVHRVYEEVGCVFRSPVEITVSKFFHNVLRKDRLPLC